VFDFDANRDVDSENEDGEEVDDEELDACIRGLAGLMGKRRSVTKKCRGRGRGLCATRGRGSFSRQGLF
jgi:hypothetical protein